MANGELHTLRFANNGVEFELRGSDETIAKAWSALEPHIVRAFQTPPTLERVREQEPPGEQSSTRTTTRRRARSVGGPAGSSPSASSQKLSTEDISEFPDVGDDPSARIAGYATLNWAKEKLGTDSLTVPDIHTFLSKRRGIPHSVNAYREAFKGARREVQVSGTNPQTWSLMAPGKSALAAYLAKLSEGGTAEDAETAANKAAR